ncbi:unnamed protein product [Amoebophrya sp. A25]|nr:unnamed protein product [Amoebophrya sp. A25]|eukprot:GSA25T00005940001.1
MMTDDHDEDSSSSSAVLRGNRETLLLVEKDECSSPTKVADFPPGSRLSEAVSAFQARAGRLDALAEGEQHKIGLKEQRSPALASTATAESGNDAADEQEDGGHDSSRSEGDDEQADPIRKAPKFDLLDDAETRNTHGPSIGSPAEDAVVRTSISPSSTTSLACPSTSSAPPPRRPKISAKHLMRASLKPPSPCPDLDLDSEVEDGSSNSASDSEKESDIDAAAVDGKTHYQAGNWAKAADCWARTLRSVAYVNGRDAFKNAPEKQDEMAMIEATTHLNLAQCYLKLEEFTKSVEECDKVLKARFPKFLEVDLGAGKPSARSDSRKITRTPNISSSSKNLASTSTERLLPKDDQDEEGTENADSSGKKEDEADAPPDPQLVKVLYRKALALKSRGRLSDLHAAASVLNNQLIPLDPNNLAARTLRAEVLQRKKKADKEEKELSKKMLLSAEIVTDKASNASWWEATMRDEETGERVSGLQQLRKNWGKCQKSCHGVWEKLRFIWIPRLRHLRDVELVWEFNETCCKKRR